MERRTRHSRERSGLLPAAAALALLAACASEAADAPAYAQPASVRTALAELRHSQAPAADWAGFQAGSSVTYRRVGKSQLAGQYNETVTQILTQRAPDRLRFEMVLEDGERNPWLPARTDAPELAAAAAEKVGEEDIYVGATLFHTEIYGFHFDDRGRDVTHLFWMAAGAPDGVVRHRETVIYDPTYTGRKETRLTALNAELKAGTTTVHGYCFETVEGLRGNGRFRRAQICKSDAVPGAVVTGEQVEVDGERQDSYVHQTVERFEAVR